MAGQFLSIEEAAAHLGKTEAEVRQLVDQRKISALRDTSGPKFRVDDLDRYLADLADETGEAATDDSGLSLDGLELDLQEDNSSPASVIIQDSAIEAGPTDAAPTPVSAAPEDAVSLILDDDLELASSPSLASDIPASDEPEASLVIGDEAAASFADGPPTMAGGDDDLVLADDDDSSPSNDLANAPSILVGSDDAIEIEGLDMSLAGSLSGIELSGVDEPASAAPADDAAQSLAVADSLAGDLDLESLVAASGLDDLASIVASEPASAPGSGLFGEDSGVADIGSGILVDSDPGNSEPGSSAPGSELSNVDMEGGLSLEGDEVKPWAVDLGEFLNDAEDDAHAATMLGTADQFDLGHEGSGDDPSQSADLASAGDSSMFAKSTGPGDSSFFGQELDDGPTGLTQASEMMSSSQYGFGVDTTTFDAWQVTGLICCAVLLLVGGLLTFDLVRTIGSAGDTTLANPLVGGLAQAFGWSQ